MIGTPYSDGKTARQNGYGIFENPYVRESDQWKLWHMGWQYADTEINKTYTVWRLFGPVEQMKEVERNVQASGDMRDL